MPSASTKEEEENWKGDTDTLYSTLSNGSTLTANSTYPEPTYTASNTPNDADFHTLLVTNTGLVNLSIAIASTPSTPLFYVTNSQWTRGKPSVTLSRDSKTGATLGVLKLSPFSSENTVGIGDPGTGKDGKWKGEMEWESLNCTSKWTHSTYEFEFRGKRFTWQRTRQRIFGDQPDLELRETVENEVVERVKGKEALRDGIGSESAGGSGKENKEVLAVYKGCQGFVSRKRGTFSIRKNMGGGFGGGNQRWENGGSSNCSAGDEWCDWEVMVLLTGCGIIEASRRRARQRRRGGGGG
jgi:hypothetical protein